MLKPNHFLAIAAAAAMAVMAAMSGCTTDPVNPDDPNEGGWKKPKSLTISYLEMGYSSTLAVYTFGYDEKDRLARLEYSLGSFASFVFKFEYKDNQTEIVIDATDDEGDTDTYTFTYDYSLNEDGTIRTWNGLNFDYDKAGHLTKGGGGSLPYLEDEVGDCQLQWDEDNRISSVSSYESGIDGIIEANATLSYDDDPIIAPPYISAMDLCSAAIGGTLSVLTPMQPTIFGVKPRHLPSSAETSRKLTTDEGYGLTEIYGFRYEYQFNEEGDLSHIITNVEYSTSLYDGSSSYQIETTITY